MPKVLYLRALPARSQVASYPPDLRVALGLRKIDEFEGLARVVWLLGQQNPADTVVVSLAVKVPPAVSPVRDFGGFRPAMPWVPKRVSVTPENRVCRKCQRHTTNKVCTLYDVPRNLVTFVLVMSVLLLAFSGMASAKKATPKRPAGVPPSAVKVDASKFRTVEVKKLKKQTTCAQLKPNRWTAGVRLKGDWFASYTYLTRYAQTQIRAAKKKGKPTAKLEKKRAEYRQFAAYGHSACFVRVSQPSCTSTATPENRGVPLRFGVSTAIGIALNSSNGSGSSSSSAVSTSAGSSCIRRSTRQAADSGIRAVLADGALRDAVVSGFATVKYAVISPAGRLYVVFQSRVDLENSGQGIYSSTGCVIAEVDRATGVPACVDDNIQYVNAWSWNGRFPIQFDASGGVYYSGSKQDGCCGSTTVLRRAKNGVLTDLTNGQINVEDFYVTPAGEVFISGFTQATSARFVRKIGLSGSISSFSGGTNWLPFPDGNVYMNGSGCINQYNVSTFTVATDWLCGYSLPQANRFGVTTGGEAFIGVSTGDVARVYPGPGATFPTGLSSLTIMRTSGTKVYLAGTAGTEETLVQFDATTRGATVLSNGSVGGQGEIEYYHLIAETSGDVVFDGLRFHDNTYVIGRINGTSGAVTILNTASGRLTDFQVF